MSNTNNISQLVGDNPMNNSKQYALAGANSTNNRLIVNGSSGDYNNNNRFNGNALRPFLEFNFTEANDSNRLVSYSKWFYIHSRCRRHKASKKSTLEFELRLFVNIKDIADSVEYFEVIPRQSTTFVVVYPKIREVIAAYFGDREIQTYYVSCIEKLLESYLNAHSYSCRVGKGTLRAIIHLQDVIFEATNGYTEDAWVFAKDLQSFFMNIDTEIWTAELIRFIDENYHERDKELLKYLTRIIYQQQPQNGALIHSPRIMWEDIPENKKLMGRVGYKGIPIGDLTSQIMALFVTTMYIHHIEQLSDGISHYTDDTAGVTRDKETFLSQQQFINQYSLETYGLKVNENKVYFQHYTKGIQYLGFKIKRDRLLPSDRIYHNFTWKIDVAIRRADTLEYVLHNKERLQCTVNSYLGLLKWCNAYKLRKRQIERLKESMWAAVYVFDDDYFVIRIKKEYSLKRMYKNKGKQLKKTILVYENN